MYSLTHIYLSINFFFIFSIVFFVIYYSILWHVFVFILWCIMLYHIVLSTFMYSIIIQERKPQGSVPIRLFTYSLHTSSTVPIIRLLLLRLLFSNSYLSFLFLPELKEFTIPFISFQNSCHNIFYWIKSMDF